MRLTAAPVTLWFLHFALLSCSSTDSENVRTKGIRADFDVIAVGNGTMEVNARLLVGSEGFGQTRVELSDGDSLTATAEAQTNQLSERKDKLDDVAYHTSFQDDTPGTLITVAFTRSEGESAPNSFVTLPEPFTLTAPAPGTSIASNQTITLAWDGALGGKLDLIERLICRSGEQEDSTYLAGIGLRNIPDTGNHEYHVAEIFDPDEPAKMTPCTLTLTLERRNEGTLDPNFGEGGRITASQLRSVAITIVSP